MMTERLSQKSPSGRNMVFRNGAFRPVLFYVPQSRKKKKNGQKMRHRS
nr:MAG TPA: hypothetical protein [Caudoviricetes sp.]